MRVSHLHAQADAQVWDLLGARVVGGQDLALHAAPAKAAYKATCTLTLHDLFNRSRLIIMAPPMKGDAQRDIKVAGRYDHMC